MSVFLINSKIVKNIKKIFLSPEIQNIKLLCDFNNLTGFSYNFYTIFPQKLWKTSKVIIFLIIFALLSVMLSLHGCGSSKGTKKAESIQSEQGLLSMDEEQIRQKLGEPTAISKTTENNTLWTYKPSWRIIPYNKDTLYIEFENGKVVRVYKVR